MISVLLLRNKTSVTDRAAIRLGREMPRIIAEATADDGPHADISAQDVSVSMVTRSGPPEDGSPLVVQILMLPRALCVKRVRDLIRNRIKALNLIKEELGDGSIRLTPG